MVIHGVPRTSAELKTRAGFMDFFRAYGLNGWQQPSLGDAGSGIVDYGMEMSAIDEAMHLRGLGDGTALPDASSVTSSDDTSIATTVQNVVTGTNAELIFLQNQVRAAQGLPPLPASQSAPTVNVGLSTETLAVVGVGIIALLLAFARRKRR